MLQQAASYVPRPSLPQEVSQVESLQIYEQPKPVCTRCCAVGTHYLTCPTLRLPPGYRLSKDPEAQ